MIVRAEARARGLTTVFGGMTAATVFGVPLASSAGNVVGWRGAMMGVAALTAVALVLVAWLLPSLEAEPAPTFRVFGEVLRSPGTLPIVSTTLLVMTAQFTVYGVAGAYLGARFGATPGMVALLLFGYDAVGTTGNATSAIYLGMSLGSLVGSRFLPGLAPGRSPPSPCCRSRSRWPRMPWPPTAAPAQSPARNPPCSPTTDSKRKKACPS